VVLLIPLLGMMAFSIDVGYMILAQTELQNAADAAALAGVQKLMTVYAQWATPTLTSGEQAGILTSGKATASQAARTYARYNKAAGVSVHLQDADIVFGFTDAQGNFSTSLADTVFPNTVQVIARRDNTGDSQSNGPLALFFGPILGTGTVNLATTARATIYTGTATGFSNTLGVNSLLLPVAVDVNDWNQFFINGTGVDVNNNAPNGLPQLNIYPGGGGQPGNNGLLSLNGVKAPPDADYAGTNGWIQAGPTTGNTNPPSDIAGLYSAGDLPLPTTSNWAAGPGMKSTLLSDFQAVEGEPKILPLYDTSGSNGSDAWYHIVEFVGVTITYAELHGNKMTIDVQPCPAVDATAIISNPAPLGVGGSSPPSFIFLPPKLTN
jgi:hypothetical protein